MDGPQFPGAMVVRSQGVGVGTHPHACNDVLVYRNSLKHSGNLAAVMARLPWNHSSPLRQECKSYRVLPVHCVNLVRDSLKGTLIYIQARAAQAGVSKLLSDTVLEIFSHLCTVRLQKNSEQSYFQALGLKMLTWILSLN